MEELIQEAREAWRNVRDKQVQQCRIRGDHCMADKLAQCTLFCDIKNLAQLANLIFSPQGVEFMTRYKFPDIKLLRKLKAYQPERYGIYIDTKDLKLQNAKRVFIAGNTTAVLDYETLAAYRVVAMHEAKATINADGYASIAVEGDGTASLFINRKGRAHIC